jgi:hypothetical protein
VSVGPSQGVTVNIFQGSNKVLTAVTGEVISVNAPASTAFTVECSGSGTLGLEISTQSGSAVANCASQGSGEIFVPNNILPNKSYAQVALTNVATTGTVTVTWPPLGSVVLEPNQTVLATLTAEQAFAAGMQYTCQGNAQLLMQMDAE